MAKTNESPVRALMARTDKVRPTIDQLIPDHLDADRLIRGALVACVRDPKLMQCSPESIVNSIVQAAQLGLEINSALGSAYLVPFGKTCQLIPGYRGLIDLARRSGGIRRIEAHVVYEKDTFTHAKGTAPSITHVPCYEQDKGPPKLVYAVAWFDDGSTQAEVMTMAEIEGIRKRSKAGNSGPWQTDYNEMARKTVVRRLSKYLPLSPQLAEALAHDNAIDAEGRAPIMVDGPLDSPEQVQEAAQSATEEAMRRLRDDMTDEQALAEDAALAEREAAPDDA